MDSRKKKGCISVLAVTSMTLVLSLAGCGQPNQEPSSTFSTESSTKQVSVTNDFRKESYVNGTIYQLSAEVKALQQQAYDLARIRLDEKLAHKEQYSKPLAIVSDIDATLMDDATYMADIIQREVPWDNGPWDYYYDAIASTGCKALPGAVEFCTYAAGQGVEMFYITNRDHDKLDLTIQQLKRAGFPNADADHVQVMNKEGSSNKTERRANVTKDHDVLFYMGDNIGDFTADFERELGPIKRAEMATADQYKDLWGDKWIVLPNATYGDYVGAVWSNDKNLDAAGRVEKIKALFDHYKFTNKEFENWYQADK